MEKYYSQIDAYIKQEMTKSEKSAFKAAMQANPALEEEVKLNILARQTTELMAQKDWKNKITQWKTEQTESAPSNIEQNTTTTAPVVSLWRRLSIAASILILVVAGLGWWANANYSNSGLVADQYLSADLAGSKGSSANLELAFEKGMDAFVAGNYATAIQQLSLIDATNANHLAAQYYLGHSHYLQKNYAAANTTFEWVLAQDALPIFINRDKLKWNLALSYLADNQSNTKLKTLLNDLATTGTAPYNQKAKDLQQDLDSVWRKLVF